MKRENIQAIFPLLPSQEAFWLARLHAKNDPGCLQSTYRFEGEMDLCQFKSALDQAFAQHSILRATVKPRPEKSPLLVVWKESKPELAIHDLRGLSESAKEAKVQAIRHQDLETGVTPESENPHRFHLIQLADSSHELVWTFHHLFLDGWSSAIVVRDVLGNYGRLSVDAPFPVGLAKFEDYLAWRKSDDVDVHVDFWKNQLKGYAGLPKKFANPLSFGGNVQQQKKVSRVLDAGDCHAIEKVCKTHGLTAGSIASGLWGLTLSNIHSENDIAFGATVSGRSVPIDHAQEMVGLFANVLPIRLQIDDSQSVVDYLRSARDQQFAAQSHEHLPLADISAVCKLRRDRVLFDSLLVVENFPSYESDGPLRLIDFDGGISTTYPLTLCVIPTRSWSVEALYDSELVDAEIVKAVVDRFVIALQHLNVQILSTVDQFQQALPEVAANEDGKVVDESLARSLEAEADQGDNIPGAIGNPRTDTELKLTMIWERLLGLSEVRINDDFFQVGGNSLTATRVVAAINDSFRTSLLPSVLIEHPSIESLANLLQGQESISAASVLISFNEQTEQRPLICVNVGTESSMFYRHLAKYFSDRPVIGTQSRGLFDSERPYSTVEEAASDLIQEVDKLLQQRGVKQGPFDLLGYCAGCSVAFEVARQLESSNRNGNSLTIIDSGLQHPKTKIRMGHFKRAYPSFPTWLKKYFWHVYLTNVLPKAKSVVCPILAKFERVGQTQSWAQRFLIQQSTMKAYFDYKIEKTKTPMMLVRSKEYADLPDKDFHLKLKEYSLDEQLRVAVVDGIHQAILLEPAVAGVAEQVRAFSDYVANKAD